ncbi:MAG: hypothetical protein AAGA83_07965 [Cyanobacteria bacterium P01_F01_bin.116]
MTILATNISYTFNQIFDLKPLSDELANTFGYSFIRTKLNLLQTQQHLSRLDELRNRIEEILPYVDLSNETSRREILISPVVSEVAHYTKAKLCIEYPITVSKQLQGNLDYLFQSHTNLLTITAKYQDLDYGMTQLIAQFIALDQWEHTPEQPTIIGAVTTGKLWEFTHLNRATKTIQQGLESYRVPEDLEDLIRILVHALSTT